MAKALFTDQWIELAKKQGAPDPEHNAAIGNAVIEHLMANRFEEAESLIEQVTDPDLVADLKNMVFFHRTESCIQPT